MSRRPRPRFAQPRSGGRLHRLWPFPLSEIGVALALIAIGVAVYWPVLHGGVLWDDDAAIFQNVLVQAGDGLRRMWLSGEPVDYWPLTNSVLWVEWRLWGAHTLGYHSVTLGLHLASALVLWRLLRRLEAPGAFLAAAIFVVHPINVESVAWMVQLKNTLCLLFFLLSLRAFVAFEDSHRPAWYVASLAAFLAAMLSKGAAAVLPGVLLLLAWWRRGTIERRDANRTLPFWIVATALTVVNIWFQHRFEPGAIRDITVLERVLGAPAVLWFYVSKMLVPVGLLFVYPQWAIRADSIAWWLPLAAACATSALLIWKRRVPAVRAALGVWLFVGLTLLPVMGLTDVYYMKYSLVADHYAYFAIVGVSAGLAAAIVVLTRRFAGARAWIPGVIGASVLALFGFSAWRHSHDYRDAETLYRLTLTGNPSAWLVHNTLGLLIVRRSPAEAVEHFRTAATLRPNLVEAHNNLCQALTVIGRPGDAVTECRRAIEIRSTQASAHNGLGAALTALGQSADARREFEIAVLLNPALVDARRNLGNVLAAAEQPDAAIVQYEAALELSPDQPLLLVSLGDALLDAGRPREAAARFSAALASVPTSARAENGLGAALQAMGRLTEAEAHFRSAVRLAPDSSDAYRTLGDLLMEQGRTPEALEQYTRAMGADPSSMAARRGFEIARRTMGRTDTFAP